MPEAPELAIIAQELREYVIHQRVIRVEMPKPKGGPPLAAMKKLEGATISAVHRRGKILVLEFSSGYSLIIHLMMTGQILLLPPFSGEAHDVRLTLSLVNGSVLSLGQVALKYVNLVHTDDVEQHPSIAKLGLDVLAPQFTAARLRTLVHGRRAKIKALLLNQSIVAGIGNTYADEILFAARIHPARYANSLSNEEIQRLYNAIVDTLQRGIDFGGSSEMAFVHIDGQRGHFQEHFAVKHRRGKPCPICKTAIERITLSGRGTYLCPSCQKG